MSRAHRPIRSLERKINTRVKPPGQPGRPRKHHPPVFQGRPYEAKLVATVRATYHDEPSGSGVYAVVQQADKLYRVFTRDESLTNPIVERREAVKQARIAAAEYDRTMKRRLRMEAQNHLRDVLDRETPRFYALSNEEKIASGKMIDHEAREIWRSRPHLLCIPQESQIIAEEWSDDGDEFGYRIRNDIREWLSQNDIFVALYILPFAEISHGGRLHPVFCYVLSFREAAHVVWFKLRWWGDDHLPA